MNGKIRIILMASIFGNNIRGGSKTTRPPIIGKIIFLKWEKRTIIFLIKDKV